MKPLSKKAVKILNKVKAHILEEPRRFEMGRWIEIKSDTQPEVYDPTVHVANQFDFGPCGTAACVGGWVLLLNGHSAKEVSRISKTIVGVSGKAAILLGITSKEEDYLFGTLQWPTRYRKAFQNQPDVAKRAKIACQRIDYFIKHRR